MVNRGRTAHIQLGIAIALAGALLAGCGGASNSGPAGSQSPGVSPTPSPTLKPTPTATPEPDAATVIATLDDRSAVEFEVTAGFVVEGAERLPLNGTYTSAPQGSYWHVAMDGDTPIELELIEFRGKRYVRGPNEVPWFDETSRYAGQDVIRALGDVTAWTSLDRTTVDGQPAWAFEATDSAPVYVPGLTTDGLILEPWATVVVSATGTILAITVTEGWAAAGSKPGDPVEPIFLSLTPKSTSPAEIPLAEPVWERFTSSRYGYTIGVPRDVTPVATDAGDMFSAGGGEFLAVLPEKQPAGVTLDAYVQAFLDASKKGGWEPTGSGIVSVNDCEYVMYAFKEKAPDGTDMVYRFILTLVDGVGYQLVGSARPEHEQLLHDLMPLYACTFHAPQP